MTRVKNDKLEGPCFITSLQNISSGCLLESPHRGDSNKFSQNMFLEVLNNVLG